MVVPWLFPPQKYCWNATYHLCSFLFPCKLGKHKAVCIYFLQVMKYIACGQLMNSAKRVESLILQPLKAPCYCLLAIISALTSSNFFWNTSDEQELPFKYTQLYFKNVMHNSNLRYFLLVNVHVTKACNDDPSELGKARHCSCKNMTMLVVPIERVFLC